MLAVNQRADERLDYDVDFEKWLSEDDSVQSAEAVTSLRSNDPEAVGSLVIDSVMIFGAVVKLWVSGGAIGESYTVTTTATSAQGRIKEECFTIRIKGC